MCAYLLGMTSTLIVLIAYAELHNHFEQHTPVNKAETCIAAYRSTGNIEYLADARIQLEVEILSKKKLDRMAVQVEHMKNNNSRSL